MLIVGMDPGYTSGGLVLIQNNRVIAVQSLRPDKTSRARAKAYANTDETYGDKKFAEATVIAKAQAQQAKDTLQAWSKEYGDLDIIAIETFIDQRSRAREEKAQLLKERWKTPLMIGALLPMLDDLNLTDKTVWQDAGRVIRHFRQEIDLIATYSPHKRDAVMKGDHLLKNDHLRKAWAHGAWREMRVKDLTKD